VPIRLIEQDFRAKVLRTSTNGLRFIIFAKVLLAQAEVCKLQVSPLVNQNVLWLKITIQYVLLVQVFKGQYHLRNQQLRLLCSKASMLLNKVKQVSTWTKINHQKEIVLASECRVELYQEWIRVHIELCKNIPLADDLSHTVHVSVGKLFRRHTLLLVHHDLVLVNHLHGEQPSVCLVPYLNYFGKCPFAKHLDELVVEDTHPLFLKT